MGAPSKYKPDMCQQVLDCMAEGMPKKAVAKELGIAYNTFLSYTDQHEAFALAVEEGEHLAEVYWQDQFEKGALGQNKDVNPTMMIFYMKNRFNWRDRLDQHLTAQGLPLYEDWLADGSDKDEA